MKFVDYILTRHLEVSSRLFLHQYKNALKNLFERKVKIELRDLLITLQPIKISTMFTGHNSMNLFDQVLK